MVKGGYRLSMISIIIILIFTKFVTQIIIYTYIFYLTIYKIIEYLIVLDTYYGEFILLI